MHDEPPPSRRRTLLGILVAVALVAGFVVALVLVRNANLAEDPRTAAYGETLTLPVRTDGDAVELDIVIEEPRRLSASEAAEHADSLFGQSLDLTGSDLWEVRYTATAVEPGFAADLVFLSTGSWELDTPDGESRRANGLLTRAGECASILDEEYDALSAGETVNGCSTVLVPAGVAPESVTFTGVEAPNSRRSLAINSTATWSG